ncbi:serine/threonine-protein kinase-like protein [Pseudovirgaria hyperparasitica]|uniref:Serine/threonine-protein kinase-like protein n=1 Tax=Pseudovirgaria hyperparasitica TaxID=470096 RepID=A0A6A6WF18_9PEZI|nr:serine/threonine-protein kinase-like protein [Pseudovirgaria hyperparasitica]KAF2760177.1 serine/threonine-protein kinase-like protein [Pseudovirgaria hyperparasitica]
MSTHVVEYAEAFETVYGDLTFSHTKIIAKHESSYLYALSDRRFRAKSEIDLQLLTLVPIPSSNIWPDFPSHFTRAPDDAALHYHVKRPHLIDYGDTEVSTRMSDVMLHEAQICEILRRSPHPNIAQYHGCVVDDGKISGLCFERYDHDLLQESKSQRSFSLAACLTDIRRGLTHLHGLGIIHCDINPSNILCKDGRFVIGDFDSCAFEGQELGLKGGTIGWRLEDCRVAKRENDFFWIVKD